MIVVNMKTKKISLEQELPVLSDHLHQAITKTAYRKHLTQVEDHNQKLILINNRVNSITHWKTTRSIGKLLHKTDSHSIIQVVDLLPKDQTLLDVKTSHRSTRLHPIKDKILLKRIIIQTTVKLQVTRIASRLHILTIMLRAASLLEKFHLFNHLNQAKVLISALKTIMGQALLTTMWSVPLQNQ